MTTTWASGRSHREPESRGCRRREAVDGKNERNDKTDTLGKERKQRSLTRKEESYTRKEERLIEERG